LAIKGSAKVLNPIEISLARTLSIAVFEGAHTRIFFYVSLISSASIIPRITEVFPVPGGPCIKDTPVVKLKK
jgi:hypothetical protein